MPVLVPLLVNEVFVDTSALYALLVETDDKHPAARGALPALRGGGANLVTSSFVVLESVTLLQSRIGVAAVRAFHDDVMPLLVVVWVGEGLLHRATASLLAASHRSVSLTDWSSFMIMRERGIERAFAFDGNFARQGFDLVPTSASSTMPGSGLRNPAGEIPQSTSAC